MLRLSSHLRPIPSLADKGAAAAGSLREHNPVWVLGCPLHKLDNNILYKIRYYNFCLYLDAGVVLPVPHGLLEQRLVDAAAS